MKSRFKVNAAKAARPRYPPETVLQVGCGETVHYSAAVNCPKVSAESVGLPRLGGAVVSPLNQHDFMQKRALLGLPQDALL